MKTLFQTVNIYLEGVYGNKTASTIIGLFLVLYEGLAAPKLPKYVTQMFNNSTFRLVVLFLVAYMSSRNTSTTNVALVFYIHTLSSVKKIAIILPKN